MTDSLIATAPGPAPEARRHQGIGSGMETAHDDRDGVVIAPFSRALLRRAADRSDIFGLSADLAKYTDMLPFAEMYPDRFVNVGMAEQNLIGIAAGLAAEGFTPVATTYGVFATRRALDFLTIQGALMRRNIKVVAGLPGLTTGYGATHQAIDDIAIMRAVPDLVVLDPADAVELEQATLAMLDYDGPVYMRLLRGAVPIETPKDPPFVIGKSRMIREGSDCGIIASGIMVGRALKAAEQLMAEGISVAVLSCPSIKPFDNEGVTAFCTRFTAVVTAENHSRIGGLFSAVAEAMALGQVIAKVIPVAIDDTFGSYGSLPYLSDRFGLSTDHVIAACRAAASGGGGQTYDARRPTVTFLDIAAAEAVSAAPKSFKAGAIKAIETFRWPQQPNCLWVEVHTESGLVGLGETFYTAGAVEAVIHDMAAGLLLGRDAEARTTHWRNLFACANFSGYAGAEMRAFSAIDIALWDVAGKVLDRPIHGLLGGAVRDDFEVYNTCADAGAHDDQYRSLNDPEGLAVELLGLGHTAMKLWPFDRYAPQINASFMTGPAGWSAMGPAGSHINPKQVAEGVSVIARIREAVGNELEIIIEGHSRWDLNSALRILRGLAPYDVLWVEDIIQPDSVSDLRRLADETGVPQAVSERCFTRYRYREVLEAKAASVVMLDVAWTGGLSESSVICDLAEAYHLPVAPHDCTGPVTALANLHLCAAKPNIITTETVRGFLEGYYSYVLDAPLPVAHGRGRPPAGPGLGATLSDAFRADPTVTRRRTAL